MGTRLIAPPALEPITLAEVKLHAKIDHAVDDDLIERILIPAARRQCSAKTHRATTTAEYEFVSNGFPMGAIRLLYPPLVSIDSFLYLDGTGLQQVIAEADYYIDVSTEPGTIAPIYDGEWPETRNDINAVRIRYRAGYGDPEDVPENMRIWMLMYVADLYRNRHSMVIGDSASVLPERFVDGLLDEFQIPYVI